MVFSTKTALYESLKRFQKCLRMASAATSLGEAQAAEAAARRVMESAGLNPLTVPDHSVYDTTNFADNALLLKLREERCNQDLQNPKRRKRGPKQQGVKQKVDPADYDVIRRKPDPLWNIKLEDDFMRDVSAKAADKAKPTGKPVNTKAKPSSDRNRDRHSPGYMRDYMRRRREKQRD
jgi:hypothetical protein